MLEAFLGTVAAGVIGLYLGGFIGLEGYLGIILAIATMGAFIISAIKENQKK